MVENQAARAAEWGGKWWKRFARAQKIRQREGVSLVGNRQPHSKEFAVNRKTHKGVIRGQTKKGNRMGGLEQLKPGK